jgi:hypothetical protein
MIDFVYKSFLDSYGVFQRSFYDPGLSSSQLINHHDAIASGSGGLSLGSDLSVDCTPDDCASENSSDSSDSSDYDPGPSSSQPTHHHDAIASGSGGLSLGSDLSVDCTPDDCASENSSHSSHSSDSSDRSEDYEYDAQDLCSVSDLCDTIIKLDEAINRLQSEIKRKKEPGRQTYLHLNQKHNKRAKLHCSKAGSDALRRKSCFNAFLEKDLKDHLHKIVIPGIQRDYNLRAHYQSFTDLLEDSGLKSVIDVFVAPSDYLCYLNDLVGSLCDDSRHLTPELLKHYQDSRIHFFGQVFYPFLSDVLKQCDDHNPIDIARDYLRDHDTPQPLKKLSLVLRYVYHHSQQRHHNLTHNHGR